MVDEIHDVDTTDEPNPTTVRQVWQCGICKSIHYDKGGAERCELLHIRMNQLEIVGAQYQRHDWYRHDSPRFAVDGRRLPECLKVSFPPQEGEREEDAVYKLERIRKRSSCEFM